MNKKLAIKGHSTRGKEVIEILEMLGGKNIHKYDVTRDDYVYVLSERGSILAIPHCNIHLFDCVIFTLEEFLEKYPYKVGDKIPAVWGNPCTVKSMSWDENYKTVMYGFEETIFVVRGDELYVNNIINNHTESTKMKNVLAELLEHIKTTPKEDLEREFEEIAEWSNVGPTVEEFMDFCNKIIKNPKYSKTYRECFYTLYGHTNDAFNLSGVTDEEYDLIGNFIKLTRCRDAYWKIAGEELGLESPWKFENPSRHYVFTIENFGGKIQKNTVTARILNRILVFPTEEMCDAFYENFKDLIESCKELL